MDKDFLLKTYGAVYDPEAGPWNLSVENKYLEYKITEFFEENFSVGQGADLCNIGIGAGYWDRYLSYRLNGGSLTSVDIEEQSCRQLREGLVNEKNPNKVTVIPSDVMLLKGLDNHFDIVTLIGSTRTESGLFESILKKAFSLAKPGGGIYYQALSRNVGEEEIEAERAAIEALCKNHRMKVEHFVFEKKYGIAAQYWKIGKK